ncbi:MAG: hypothetical protein AAGI44_04710 [Pseudomonadota bacterium]
MTLSATIILTLFAASLGCCQVLLAQEDIETDVCVHEEILEIGKLKDWIEFHRILCDRMSQSEDKMKLSKTQAQDFIVFLSALKTSTPELLKLKNTLPKTTLELLRAVASRGLSLKEAERIAKYLETVPATYAINNIAYFDENTSHIIGREWHEIDYSGEGMTWQKQKQKYAPYHITDFKSLDNLERFFPVESTLPYFRQAYE